MCDDVRDRNSDHSKDPDVSTSYTLTVTLPLALDDADERVRAALGEQGFGVLSEIDVQAALAQKLDHHIGGYRILGACNPPLARDAIAADADIGALLPCNVLLRENAEGGTDVVAADPHAMLSVAGEALAPIADDARTRLDAALASLTA